ncbi:MAG TPA: 2-oxoglutarate and iron-dependent oxygenase domain-containing protein [Actinomycetospora sp.]|nr:2-oxoglutarate and iron-dependent oxygenase domain-containing protein [Actinomycetospora sp.]
MTGTLPVLDLARFRSVDREAFLDDLRRAAREVGFFTVVGHDIPRELTERLDEEVRRFFALPLADRLAIENTASPHFRGYSRVGTERTAGAADQREQIDVGPERAPVDGPERYWGLVGPNQWPPAQPGLREAVLAWQDEALRVSREILRALAVASGQREGHFDRWFDEESHLHLKVVHYPGGGSTGQGVGAHKDYGFLALLHQDDVGGLQVQVPGTDEWLDAAPVPDGYVVNIGEMLEVATRGYLTATRHRVASPPPGVDRYSVPFFLGPRLDAVVEPLDLPPDLAAEAGAWDPAQDPDNPLLAAYGENALIGWLRSHPAVAARWWS